MLGAAAPQPLPEGQHEAEGTTTPNPEFICPSGSFWEHTGTYMSS